MSQTGQKIYALRRENKLTQQELAVKLGKTAKLISFYERGERMPSREVLTRLSVIFDVSIDYLLDKTSDPRTAAALIREKFGFYYPFQERENMKKSFDEAMATASSLAEKVKLCESDMKQYFSRSVDSSGFNLNHTPFADYAAMLLNQNSFKARYGEAYDALAAKYPPKPGIAEGRTHHAPIALTHGEDMSEQRRGVARLLERVPEQNIPLLEKLLTSMVELGREDNPLP